MRCELGDEVRDIVTGFNGIAVARTIWLCGCDRITIQPRLDKDGMVPEPLVFDEPQIKVVKRKTIRVKLEEESKKESSGGSIPVSNWA